MIQVSRNLFFYFIVLLCLLSAQEAAAQKKGSRTHVIRTSPHISEVYTQPVSHPQGTSVVRDTLRNFVKGNTLFRIPASDIFTGETGWVHGTNSFQDISKATRISLPTGVTSALLEEVHVTFVHKANQVTTENYAIEIYDVDSNGGPGNLLGMQIYSYQFVNADEDLATPAFTSLHILNTPVTVPQQFFISVDLGAYDSSGFANIDIASTDFLGRFVSEDWEKLSDGTWINMSDSWFSNSDNGWLMWMEAVVDINVGGGGSATINHTPPQVVPEGNDFVARADLISADGIATAAIAYLQGGSAADPVLSLMNNVGGNTWEGIIPAAFVDLSGFQYAIGLTDNFGVSTTTNTFNVNVSTTGVNRNLGIQGTTASNYRLFSIPINLDNKNAANILEDDLGTYDPEVWRLFGLNADQSYSEFPSSGLLQSGAAFWLASRDMSNITTGPGTSNSIANDFSIPLNSGWTFVGTPFNFAVPQNQLRLASGSLLDIRAYNGSWANLNGSLQPFSGYAIAATTTDQLLVSPFPTVTKTETPAVTTLESNYEWAIQISAASDKFIDNDNLAAVAQNARLEWDELDRPEPPLIGQYISLYFPHADWALPFKHFNTDVRPASHNLNEWSFEVTTNISGAMSLLFGGIQDVPETFEVVLIDHLLGTQKNLRNNPIHSIQASEKPYPNRFKLLVGPAIEVTDALTRAKKLPLNAELESFPNPFQSFSTLRVGLKSDAQISLFVYDSLGKKITTLIADEQITAGFHTLSWSGLNDAHVPVASGVYFYVLQADNKTITKRVIHLR